MAAIVRIFTCVLVLTAIGGPALSSAQAQDPAEAFGFESVSVDLSTYVAGAHPDLMTFVGFKHHLNGEGKPELNSRTQDLSIALPPGLTGNPTNVEECSTGAFEAFGNCPVESQVGITEVLLNGNTAPLVEPVYNLEPPHREEAVARLGFIGGFFPVFIDISVRTAGDYGVTASVDDATGLAPIIWARTTLWGNPADPSHDQLRLTTVEALSCSTACSAPGGKRASELPERPFITNPSACQKQTARFIATSYQLPGKVIEATAPMAKIVGCADISFAPSLWVEPTVSSAGAPTGLRTNLHIPQNEDTKALATSTMKDAIVTLPEGMAIAAGAANGLDACSESEVALGREEAAQCPDASKLGTATVTSPALLGPIHGVVYQRTPEQGRQFRLWLVSDDYGLHLKLPGEIEANADTGQLKVTFSDTPQLPVEDIQLDVWGGDRAPLKNPDSCGTYSTSFEIAPWSGNPAVSSQSQMSINSGCGPRGFKPSVEAGTTNPVAGQFSPLVVNLVRHDGDQNLDVFEVNLPEGVLAKLKGVELCPDAGAASGACPAASQIGSVTVSVGPGPKPLWIPQAGKEATAVYLAGPFKGAPFSIVTKVPAQAGPFDLGQVVVRSQLLVASETARATVRTDSLPQLIEGVPILYRTLHVAIDRPQFVLNPTSCEQRHVDSTITSVDGSVVHPGTPFRVGGCKALGFHPELSLKLKGGSRRGQHPRLTALLRLRRGDANVGRVSATLPHSEFLAQDHIRTVCTRVQFAASRCPRGSIYGRAKARTPLLDKSLEGPVYLRSSDHPLPDLVAALRGPLAIDVVARIDSRNGRIRTVFEKVPDAPISKFVLAMQGGEKGLLENSSDLCQGIHRAAISFTAQNSRLRRLRPALPADCP